VWFTRVNFSIARRHAMQEKLTLLGTHAKSLALGAISGHTTVLFFS